jgi:hypothetical protein
MAQAEAAAARYAGTLRGKLASAVQSVRAGFSGGGGGGAGGGGPGLIARLADFRTQVQLLAGSAVVVGVKRLVDGIGDIGESAQRLGVTTDQFQRLKVLADQNGSSVEGLGTAFRTLSNSAVQPTKESTAAFAKLGVSTKDASGQFKSTNDLFFDVAAALANVGNETERSALAQDLLGRSAQELKPLFANGAEGVAKMRKELGALSVLSDETIAQADALSDSWKTVGPSLLSAAEPLLKLLLPALKLLTEAMSKGIEWLGKFLKQTDFVSVALTALGGVFVTRLLPQLSVMVTLGGGATKVMTGMALAAGRAALAFLAWAIPAAIIEDFIGFLRGDESAIGKTLDMVFGKGASTGVIEALGKAWDLLASAVKRVLEAMHLFKPGDESLEQRQRADETWQGSNFQRKIVPGLKLFADLVAPGLGTLGGKAADWIGSSTASAGYGQSVDYGTMAAPGPAMSSSEPNLSIGDTHIEITMSPSASAPDVGRAVSSALSSDRDQLMSTYQSY